MLELFSPLYVLRTPTYETSQLDLYALHAVWFVLISAVVEALTQSSVKFFSQHTGWSLLWIQGKTAVRLFLSYLLCTLVIFGALTHLFQVESQPAELFRVLGLAILPRVYAVYGLIPYIGKTLFRLLNGWTLVLLFVVLQRGVGVGYGQALTCLGLSLLAYGAIYAAFSYLPQAAAPPMATAEA